jgi:hypothetical protein
MEAVLVDKLTPNHVCIGALKPVVPDSK